MNEIAEFPHASERNGPGREPLPQALVVDAEALFRTNLLLESLIALVRSHPAVLFILPYWMIRGKARFAREVHRRISLNPELLPVREGLVRHLQRERAQGRPLVLRSSVNAPDAASIACTLKMFDGVLDPASPELLRVVFGDRGFEDFQASPGPASHENPPAPGERISALRLSHWLKNLLVFVPLATAHRINSPALLAACFDAFMAFGFAASAGYLFNDLIDLDSDRRHPVKKARKFASGRLSLVWGITMIPALVCGALLISALVSAWLGVFTLAYFILSVTYSLWIKRIVILDVLFLAGLYTLRIIAGSFATAIPVSDWLLAFSTFLFFSLALVKRYGELSLIMNAATPCAARRGYRPGDLPLLAGMGIASGFLAVLVFALYIAGGAPQMIHVHPRLLWMCCPILLYWISYVWLTAHRGALTGDPVVFAMSDRTSRILLSLMILMGVVAF